MYIIGDILNGDKEKFSLLMERYHNEMFKYVYNTLGNYSLTEDLVQDIFFKLYRELPRYDATRSSFRTWMYRVSSNLVINYLKSKEYRNYSYNLEYNDKLNSSNENIEDEIIKQEKITLIQNSMRKLLSPKHYRIMALHYFSSLTVKEIGESLEIPVKTIYKALKSSVMKVKKEVDLDDEI